MTDFLASVSTLEEARLVKQLGADIIDLKNPLAGALGALPLNQIASIVTELNHSSQISATIGDLPLHPEVIIPAIHNTAKTGVDFIKIGLFEAGDLTTCLAALSTEIRRSDLALIAVLFADQAFNISLLQKLASCGFRGVMLDTANKSSGSLTSILSDETLCSFIQTACQWHLFCGLAGSLSLADVNTLVRLKPDYLGFRGALCEHSKRVASLAADNVRAIRSQIDITKQQLTEHCVISHAS